MNEIIYLCVHCVEWDSHLIYLRYPVDEIQSPNIVLERINELAARMRNRDEWK